MYQVVPSPLTDISHKAEFQNTHAQVATLLQSYNVVQELSGTTEKSLKQRTENPYER